MQATDAIPGKACPVILRRGREGAIEILAFEHPLAGCQLAKGGIESGEHPAVAALRELREESGIADARTVADMGCWASQPGEDTAATVWSFHLCAVSRELPQRWTWHTGDDGGHAFEFFWHPLDAPVDARWHPLFQRALAYVRHWVRTHAEQVHV